MEREFIIILVEHRVFPEFADVFLYYLHESFYIVKISQSFTFHWRLRDVFQAIIYPLSPKDQCAPTPILVACGTLACLETSQKCADGSPVLKPKFRWQGVLGSKMVDDSLLCYCLKLYPNLSKKGVLRLDCSVYCWEHLGDKKLSGEYHCLDQQYRSMDPMLIPGEQFSGSHSENVPFCIYWGKG